MRFYTQQHQFYGGIARHARTMYVCMLNHDGEIVGHRHLPTRPEAWRKTMAPEREHSVIAVEGMFTWYWLADLGAREGRPCVLGHALSRTAIHGGNATNDTIDAQTMAVRRRGGRLPQADVDPAKLRATRDLRRRRRHLRRQRAELLTPVQQPHGPYNVPESGQKIASQANRMGVAARCADPAVPKSLAVDRALIAHDDRVLHALEWSILNTAT
jgi:hypothetical protein